MALKVVFVPWCHSGTTSSTGRSAEWRWWVGPSTPLWRRASIKTCWRSATSPTACWRTVTQTTDPPGWWTHTNKQGLCVLKDATNTNECSFKCSKLTQKPFQKKIDKVQMSKSVGELNWSSIWKQLTLKAAETQHHAGSAAADYQKDETQPRYYDDDETWKHFQYAVVTSSAPAEVKYFHWYLKICHEICNVMECKLDQLWDNVFTWWLYVI